MARSNHTGDRRVKAKVTRLVTHDGHQIGDTLRMAIRHRNFLAEAITASGMKDPEVAAAAGTSKQQIGRLKHSKRKLSPEWAMRLAPVLGWDWRHLIEGPPRRAPTEKGALLAARIEAARLACWGEDHKLAALGAGLSEALIHRVESGIEQPDDAFMLTFMRKSKAPPAWFEEGSLDGMPEEMAARLGYYRPELVKGILNGPKKP